MLTFPTRGVRAPRGPAKVPPIGHRQALESLVFQSTATNPDYVRLVGYSTPQEQEGRTAPLIVVELPRAAVDEDTLDMVLVHLIRCGVDIRQGLPTMQVLK
jgi:hypothetical protein